jgi:hypothetical protein
MCSDEVLHCNILVDFQLSLGYPKFIPSTSRTLG